MNIPHVQLLSPDLRIGVTVIPVNPAVRRLLMLVTDNTFDLPGKRRIRAALAMVVAGFRQMPQMINHTGTDKGLARIIEGNSPRIAGSLAKDLKLASLRVDPKHRTGKLPARLSFAEVRICRPIVDVRGIKHTVQPVQPAIRTPRQRIR